MLVAANPIILIKKKLTENLMNRKLDFNRAMCTVWVSGFDVRGCLICLIAKLIPSPDIIVTETHDIRNIYCFFFLLLYLKMAPVNLNSPPPSVMSLLVLCDIFGIYFASYLSPSKLLWKCVCVCACEMP